MLSRYKRWVDGIHVGGLGSVNAFGAITLFTHGGWWLRLSDFMIWAIGGLVLLVLDTPLYNDIFIAIDREHHCSVFRSSQQVTPVPRWGRSGQWPGSHSESSTCVRPRCAYGLSDAPLFLRLITSISYLCTGERRALFLALGAMLRRLYVILATHSPDTV